MPALSLPHSCILTLRRPEKSISFFIPKQHMNTEYLFLFTSSNTNSLSFFVGELHCEGHQPSSQAFTLPSSIMCNLPGHCRAQFFLFSSVHGTNTTPASFVKYEMKVLSTRSHKQATVVLCACDAHVMLLENVPIA